MKAASTIAAIARRRVEHEAVLNAAMRVEAEIEIESESSSDAMVDTESSTEAEGSVLSLKDMIDGDEDGEGAMENEPNSPLCEPVVPERVDGDDEDALGQDEGAEREAEDGLVSPVRESVVPERVDDEDEDTASEPTSTETDYEDWAGDLSENSVDDNVAGPSRAKGGGRRKRGRPRKVYKEMSTEDGMRDPLWITRRVCVSRPLKKTPEYDGRESCKHVIK